jgi:hypothetical protein
MSKNPITINIIKESLDSIRNDNHLAYCAAFEKLEKPIFLKMSHFLFNKGIYAYPEFNRADLVIFDSFPDYAKNKKNWKSISKSYVEGKFYYSFDIPDLYDWNNLISNSNEVTAIRLDFDSLTQFRQDYPTTPAFFIYFMGHYSKKIPNYFKYERIAKYDPDSCLKKALSLDFSINQIDFKETSYKIKSGKRKGNIERFYTCSYHVKQIDHLVIDVGKIIDDIQFQIIAYILEF